MAYSATNRLLTLLTAFPAFWMRKKNIAYNAAATTTITNKRPTFSPQIELSSVPVSYTFHKYLGHKFDR